MDIQHESVYGKDYLTWKSVIKRSIWLPLIGAVLGNIPVFFFGHFTWVLVILEAVSTAILCGVVSVMEMHTRRAKVELEEALWALIDRHHIRVSMEDQS